MRKAGFVDGWRRSHAGSVEAHGVGATYPADKPTKRIDYVFHRGLGDAEASDAAVPDTLASDHRPVVVSLKF